MLIVWLEPPSYQNAGDHVYRTEQPCRALGAIDGVTTLSGTWLSPLMHTLARAADVLVLSLAVDTDLLPVIRQRRAQNKRTLFEINDNFLAVQPWNPAAGFFADAHGRALALQLASACDAIQVTMPALQAQFGHLARSECRVFPNQLWQMPAPAKKGERLRIGWAGSLGHLQDFRWLVPTLEKLLAVDAQLEVAIMAPAELQNCLPPHPRVIRRSTGSLQDYNDFVARFHIGLAPLQPTGFNLCRSDVKFLEYASHGTVAVCARLAPYTSSVEHGQTGYLFSDREELEGLLLGLLGAPAMLAQVGAAARRYVETTRLEQQHAGARLQFLTAGQGATAEFPAALPATVFADSSYRKIGPGAVEAHLYNGLLSLRDAPQTALTDLHKARRAAPEFYLTQLYLGHCVADPQQAIRLLQAALRLCPESCQTHFVLATKLAAQGKTAQATQALQACLGIEPDFAPAHEHLGLLRQSQDPEQAAQHFADALVANPHYTPPRHRLALLTQDPDQAALLLRQNIALDPGSWVDLFRLGQLCCEQGQWAEGSRLLEDALSRAPQPEPILLELAKAYLQQGQRAQAQAALAQIKALRTCPKR